MSDSFSKDQRSEIMRKVKSNRNVSTELRLIRFFKEYKITGWRRNFKLFGRPDIVFPSKRLAIFLDGCFWHGHDCRNTTPKDNKDYWEKKVARNKARDTNVTETLRNKGWDVIRLWECDLKKSDLIKNRLKTLFV